MIALTHEYESYRIADTASGDFSFKVNGLSATFILHKRYYYWIYGE